jgi:hypothetical protein
MQPTVIHLRRNQEASADKGKTYHISIGSTSTSNLMARRW